MKLTATAFIAAMVILVSPLAAHGDTNVSGTISGNTTWTTGGSPYIVTGDLYVATAGTLTIDPGVVVKFNDNISLNVEGKLLALGASGSPISFTSSRATPAAGSWLYVNFEATANPASRMSYVNVSYSGSIYGYAVKVNGSSPQFDHVTISDTNGTGLFVTGATAAPSFADGTITRSSGYGINLGNALALTLTNTTISDNGNYAIGMDARNSLNGLTGITATGNGAGAKNAIENRGGSASVSRTWGGASIPYIVTADLYVETAATLTIDPGAVVKFNDNISLQVSGKLLAVGTSGSPIVFTSSRVTPAAGSWLYVYFAPTANPASRCRTSMCHTQAASTETRSGSMGPRRNSTT